MDIFEDYLSWKYENHELIQALVKKRSKTISRFTHVISVVDYLYDQKQKNALTEDEELIFSTGYDYIYDQFQMIGTILDCKFNKNIDEMEKYSKTINLLLYINEFQSEVLNQESVKEQITELNTLEDKVNKELDNKENAVEEDFILLNDITYKIFEKNGIEVHTVDQIFYDIALEYNLVNDNDDDTYNTILTSLIEKNRNKNIN